MELASWGGRYTRMAIRLSIKSTGVQIGTYFIGVRLEFCSYSD